MAEKSVIEDAVKKLEEEITCSLCLGPLHNPKRLPCDHIYCKSPCLEELLNYVGNSTIACPECRTIAQVKDNDLDSLPSAFHIERLKDLHGEMAQVSATASKPAQAAYQPCPAHPTQLQELYCETCQKVVCWDCILLEIRHRNHKYSSVTEVAVKERQMVLKDLLDVEKLADKNAKALAEAEQVEVDIAKQRLEVTEQITSSFDALFQDLKKQKQALLDSTNKQVDQMLANIAQILDLGAASSQLQRAIESVKDAVAKDGDYEFVSKIYELRGQIAEATHKTIPLLHNPTIRPYLEVTFLQPTELRLACNNASSIRRVFLEPEPSKCVVEGEGLKMGTVDKTSTIIVKLANKHNMLCEGCITAA